MEISVKIEDGVYTDELTKVGMILESTIEKHTRFGSKLMYALALSTYYVKQGEIIIETSTLDSSDPDYDEMVPMLKAFVCRWLNETNISREYGQFEVKLK